MSTAGEPSAWLTASATATPAVIINAAAAMPAAAAATAMRTPILPFVIRALTLCSLPRIAPPAVVGHAKEARDDVPPCGAVGPLRRARASGARVRTAAMLAFTSRDGQTRVLALTRRRGHEGRRGRVVTDARKHAGPLWEGTRHGPVSALALCLCKSGARRRLGRAEAARPEREPAPCRDRARNRANAALERIPIRSLPSWRG